MNITSLSPVQLVNLVVLILFFENLLVEFCGVSRRSNLYARPSRCADSTIDNIYKMVEQMEVGSKNALVFSQSTTKYGVMNFSTLSTYGSLEIRSMRGTTDPEEIKEWLSILNKLYRYAQVPGMTPMSIYETYRQIEYDIVDRVFGRDAIRLKCKDYKDMLRRNEFWLAQIATMVLSWNKFCSIEKPEESEKLPLPLAAVGVTPYQEQVVTWVAHDDLDFYDPDNQDAQSQL